MHQPGATSRSTSRHTLSQASPSASESAREIISSNASAGSCSPSSPPGSVQTQKHAARTGTRINGKTPGWGVTSGHSISLCSTKNGHQIKVLLGLESHNWCSRLWRVGRVQEFQNIRQKTWCSSQGSKKTARKHDGKKGVWRVSREDIPTRPGVPSGRPSLNPAALHRPSRDPSDAVEVVPPQHVPKQSWLSMAC